MLTSLSTLFPNPRNRRFALERFRFAFVDVYQSEFSARFYFLALTISTLVYSVCGRSKRHLNANDLLFGHHVLVVWSCIFFFHRRSGSYLALTLNTLTTYVVRRALVFFLRPVSSISVPRAAESVVPYHAVQAAWRAIRVFNSIKLMITPIA